MEFRIKNVKVVNGSIGKMSIYRYYHSPKDDKESRMCYVVFESNYNNKVYNSLLDDFVYVNKKPITYIDAKELSDAYEKTIPISNYNVFIDNQMLFDVLEILYFRVYDRVYVRVPENKTQIMRIETVVEKVVNKNVIIKSNEIEKCGICYDNDGIMSFGCCSMKYCLNCTKEICKILKCAQCRRNVDFTHVQMEIDFLNND